MYGKNFNSDIVLAKNRSELRDVIQRVDTCEVAIKYPAVSSFPIQGARYTSKEL